MSRLNKLSWLAIACSACLYWFFFLFIDQPLAHSLHHASHESFMYPIFEMITLLGDPRLGFAFIAISFIVAIAILFKQPQNRLANNLLFMALAMVAAAFLEISLKYLLGRYRPELLFGQGLYGFHYLSHHFLMNSSPCGHATRIFVLVTSLSMIWKRLTPLFIVIGLLVCASRIILELHYLSDVVFGSLLGVLVTLWVAKIYFSLTISDPSQPFLHHAKS